MPEFWLVGEFSLSALFSQDAISLEFPSDTHFVLDFDFMWADRRVDRVLFSQMRIGFPSEWYASFWLHDLE